MNHFKSHKAGKSVKEVRQPTFTRQDKIKLAVILLTMLAAFLLWFVVGGRQASKHRLNAKLERWRVTYHLSDEQTARIREAEIRFHGSRGIFESGCNDSKQLHEHHLEISRMMNPDDAVRFLRMQESERH